MKAFKFDVELGSADWRIQELRKKKQKTDHHWVTHRGGQGARAIQNTTIQLLVAQSLAVQKKAFLTFTCLSSR